MSAIAIDVAVLLPADARVVAERLNAGFAATADGFRFDATHRPHITLGQHFVDADQLDVFAKYVVHPEHSEQNGVATHPFQTEEAPDEDSS